MKGITMNNKATATASTMLKALENAHVVDFEYRVYRNNLLNVLIKTTKGTVSEVIERNEFRRVSRVKGFYSAKPSNISYSAGVGK